MSNNNWVTGLPGVSSSMLTAGKQGPGWYNIGTVNHDALSINGEDGPVLIFRKDGTISTPHGSISVEEWIDTISLMRQFFIDVSRDTEFSERYPYIRDAAHRWVMNKLKE